MKNLSIDNEGELLTRKAELKVELAKLRVELLEERVWLFKGGMIVGIAGIISSIISIFLYHFFPGDAIVLLPLVLFLLLLSFQIALTQKHIIHALDEIRNIIEHQD